jgi:hypothetical protein
MNNHDLSRRATPVEVADQVAKTYFGVTDEFSRRRVIRQCLLGAAEASVLPPCLFYLRFRKLGPLGWGTTVFFVVYLLLTAIGLYLYAAEVRVGGVAFTSGRHTAAGLKRDECEPGFVGRANREANAITGPVGIIPEAHRAESRGRPLSIIFKGRLNCDGAVIQTA